MNWLLNLHETFPVAQAIAIICLVCVAGMSLGSIAIRGIKLGTSGVIFAAIVVGHFYKPIDHATLEFIKEFGLILFVFCIGLQLGPGFFASLRRGGRQLNFLALIVVILGAIFAVSLGWLLGIDKAAVLGILSGATTNTPSLGAAQQTLGSFPGVTEAQAALPALAYAVTYPAGIISIILSLLLLKSIMRINVSSEAAAHAKVAQACTEPVKRRTLLVENSTLQGVAIRDVPSLRESGIVVSLIRHGAVGEPTAVTGSTLLNVGDQIVAVGPTRGIDQFQLVVGREIDEDLLVNLGSVSVRRIVLTNKEIVGTTVQQLDLEGRFRVTPTRVARGELEIAATPALGLHYGDVLQVVGTNEANDRAAAYLGNSLRALNETQFVPLFAGIAAGIALGTLPIPLPGLPQPLRLGLAAGPLIVALIVGRVGRIGKLVWHMPRDANLAFREFGIALFFASVGLMAGPKFFAAAFSTAGFLWLLSGICVTMAPLLIVGLLARWMFAMNFVDILGLLAGSTTDPPALVFANGLCQSESPAVAYATVYPLTMVLRIIAAQILAVLYFG